MPHSFLRPENVAQLFTNGMKRGISFELPEAPSGPVLNLGAGRYPLTGATNLDLPDWHAPHPKGPDSSVAAIHAYHFLEHLDPPILIKMMQEVARVLMPHGLFYYCVPYAMSPIAFMDPTHRTFWTEETMRTLLVSRGYESAAVEDLLKYRFQIICGVSSQNLAILGCLERI